MISKDGNQKATLHVLAADVRLISPNQNENVGREATPASAWSRASSKRFSKEFKVNANDDVSHSTEDSIDAVTNNSSYLLLNRRIKLIESANSKPVRVVKVSSLPPINIGGIDL